MGDQSFARLIKERRHALGFSQARLGELVGRSATTIRNWERGQTTPSDRTDAVALAAILGLEERETLAQAGFELADVENRPTMEQEFASLGLPTPDQEPEPEEATGAQVPERAEEKIEEPAAPRPWRPVDLEPVSEPADADPDPEPEDPAPELGPITFEPPSPLAPPIVARPPGEAPAWVEPVDESADEEADERSAPSLEDAEARPRGRRLTRAAPPTVLETATGEPSYIEDEVERQQYRVRAFVTAAIILGMVIVLLWAFGRATDSFGQMWDDFFGQLEF